MFSRTFVIFLTLYLTPREAYSNSKFIENFEVVSFKILEHRPKRSTFNSTVSNVSKYPSDLEILFRSFGDKFHLLLYEDAKFQNLPIKLHNSESLSESINVKPKFYEGIVKNESSVSNVLGFMQNGLLTARISNEDQTFFVEPAKIFFNDFNLDSRKIVVYKDSDIRSLSWKVPPSYPENITEWYVSYRSPNVSVNVTIQNSGLDIRNLTDDLFCEVEIVADHTLYAYYNNNIDRIAAVLYLHGKFADHIFRKTDFDMNGSPDRIRIAVGKISIYKSEKDDNYPMAEASTLSDYLSQFTLRKQNSAHCLSIGVLYRKFDGMAIGEAFRAEYRFSDALGGICDQPLTDYRGSGPSSFNTGIINFQFHDGKSIPLGITLLAFTHEIGHGFGSWHDPIKDPMCSPGKSHGNYLMYPVSSVGSNNSMDFSPCSRVNIWKILLAKGGCLKYEKPKCGNGIREGLEECDCGSYMFCSLIDTCCVPSDAKPPETGCTIRREKGFSCSYKESECCDTSCRIIEDTTKECYRDEYRCLFSFCDGENATCPKPERVSESHCRPKFSCEGSSCSNSTLCESRGLQECVCKENISVECLQCCQTNLNCVPASELGILNRNRSPYILPAGSSCNNGKYRCDDVGNCTNEFSLQLTSAETYIIVISVPFLISMLLFFSIFVSCQNRVVRRNPVYVRPNI